MATGGFLASFGRSNLIAPTAEARPYRLGGRIWNLGMGMGMRSNRTRGSQRRKDFTFSTGTPISPHAIKPPEAALISMPRLMAVNPNSPHEVAECPSSGRVLLPLDGFGHQNAINRKDLTYVRQCTGWHEAVPPRAKGQPTAVAAYNFTFMK